VKAKDAFMASKEGGMVINHNLSALFANRQLGIIDHSLQKDIEHLSSGLRINTAGDDASGLAVSEKLSSQIRGLNQANRNIQLGISFIQTTEGYLQETTDILQRLRELAVQSANGIYSTSDRQMIQVEVSQLVDEVNRIASSAQFNGLNMLTGRFARGSTEVLQLQVGANMDQNKRIYIGTMTATALGLTGSQGVNISTPGGANRTIGVVDNALTRVSLQRANLGAYQNRFQLATHGISSAAENLQAAESQIRDLNMASEMVKYVKDQILAQAATAMLAQANASAKTVLQLL
jgi:flagellin